MRFPQGVKMNRRQISQILAVLLLIGLAGNWRLAIWIVRTPEPPGLAVGVMWFGLVITTVIGLWRVHRWGAYTLIVLALFSTVALSTPLLPGMHLVGLSGPVALAAWNCLALLGRSHHPPIPEACPSAN